MERELVATVVVAADDVVVDVVEHVGKLERLLLEQGQHGGTRGGLGEVGRLLRVTAEEGIDAVVAFLDGLHAPEMVFPLSRIGGLAERNAPLGRFEQEEGEERLLATVDPFDACVGFGQKDFFTTKIGHGPAADATTENEDVEELTVEAFVDEAPRFLRQVVERAVAVDTGEEAEDMADGGSHAGDVELDEQEIGHRPSFADRFADTHHETGRHIRQLRHAEFGHQLVGAEAGRGQVADLTADDHGTLRTDAGIEIFDDALQLFSGNAAVVRGDVGEIDKVETRKTHLVADGLIGCCNLAVGRGVVAAFDIEHLRVVKFQFCRRDGKDRGGHGIVPIVEAKTKGQKEKGFGTRAEIVGHGHLQASAEKCLMESVVGMLQDVDGFGESEKVGCSFIGACDAIGGTHIVEVVQFAAVDDAISLEEVGDDAHHGGTFGLLHGREENGLSRAKLKENPLTTSRYSEISTKIHGNFLFRFIHADNGKVYFPLLLSDKILRTGFSVQQFHICASRGFLTLMAAKAINGH